MNALQRIALLTAVVVALPTSAAIYAQPSLTTSQPCGVGSFSLTVAGAAPSAELFNLISLVPHTPTGGGPIFGLGLAGSADLLTEILTPLGTDPFHVTADATGGYTWSFCQTPVGLAINADLVTVEFNALGFFQQSSVVTVSVNL